MSTIKTLSVIHIPTALTLYLLQIHRRHLRQSNFLVILILPLCAKWSNINCLSSLTMGLAWLDSSWLWLNPVFTLTIKPVEQLQTQFVMMHQLDFHELFDSLNSKLADTPLQKVS